MNTPAYFPIWLLALLVAVSSCRSQPVKTDSSRIRYQAFRDSVLATDTTTPVTANVFDDRQFTPGTDSLRTWLVQVDSALHNQARLLEHLDSMARRMGQEPGFSADEQAAIRENIREVETYLAGRDSASVTGCREKSCLLYAEVDKGRQRLYLYLLGELKDSFKVSTGKGKQYETPPMSRHPAGPLLVKYTSRKFPGGNYKGLGNMPYAVFVSGGYAIHGTTPGNFSKLGHKASHGCIRLHPDDAKVFHALVKTVGLKNAWVRVKE